MPDRRRDAENDHVRHSAVAAHNGGSIGCGTPPSHVSVVFLHHLVILTTGQQWCSLANTCCLTGNRDGSRKCNGLSRAFFFEPFASMISGAG